MIDITLDNKILHLRGELRFSNVMSVYEKSLKLVDACDHLLFDLSNLKNNDSSGLALLIEWIKLARSQKKIIRFINFPQPLYSLVRISGLEHLISPR